MDKNGKLYVFALTTSKACCFAQKWVDWSTCKKFSDVLFYCTQKIVNLSSLNMFSDQKDDNGSPYFAIPYSSVSLLPVNACIWCQTCKKKGTPSNSRRALGSHDSVIPLFTVRNNSHIQVDTMTPTWHKQQSLLPHPLPQDDQLTVLWSSNIPTSNLL